MTHGQSNKLVFLNGIKRDGLRGVRPEGILLFKFFKKNALNFVDFHSAPYHDNANITKFL